MELVDNVKMLVDMVVHQFVIMEQALVMEVEKMLVRMMDTLMEMGREETMAHPMAIEQESLHHSTAIVTTINITVQLQLKQIHCTQIALAQ